MKARLRWLVVFAATIALCGPVAARGAAGTFQDPAPGPVPTPAAVPPSLESAPAAPAPTAAAAPAPVPTASVPAAAPPQQAASRHLVPLSKKEADEKLKALPPEEKKWLEYVGPIMLADERNLFLQLTEPHQREIFKEDFWKRREQQGLPSPLGPGYRGRYESFRDAAATTYGGLNSDQGKIVVLRGEPLGVQEFRDCTNVVRDIQVWTYRRSNPSGLSSDILFLFYRSSPGAGGWHLWMPMMPESELLNPMACLRAISDACRPPGAPVPPSQDSFCPGGARPQTCDQACDIVRIVQTVRLEGDGLVAAALTEPPPVEVEGLEKLAERFPTVGDPNAKPLTFQGPSSAPAPTGDAVVPASPSAKATEQTAAAGPAPTHRKLSKKEEHQLYEQLPLRYKDFLDLVQIIITPEEKEVFLEIKENYQRDKFIDSFWKRRTIDSMGIRTDFRAVYTRRVQQAVQQFQDIHNDRAKMFVINGPPTP